jgi:uncharacterized protein (DUF1684 family)
VDALDVLDWRRRVFALYGAVRAETDPAAGHDLWRRGRDRLFAEHPASPLLPDDRAAFDGLAVAPYDPAWRFEVPVREAAATEWQPRTGTDGVVPFERLGTVRLPGVGELDVWRLVSYGGGVFLPLRDGGCGKPGGGYGGGRYLLDTVKGADLGGDGDRLVVDLNFAYPPSCAYDPAWACPLAPEGNTVDVVVPVGEVQA